MSYYCVITQYSLTKINGGDGSGYSSNEFNIVPKPWHHYYTVITPNSTVLCNALYSALLWGLPSAHVARLVALGACTVL